MLDTYAAEIAESWKDNAAKWGEWIASVKPLIDLEAEVKDLKLWLTSQRDWVNTHLDLLNHVYYTITFTADDAVVSTVTLRVGKDLSELPQAPIKEGYTFTGWMDENGEIVDSVSATHDTELKAQYSADSGSAGESSVEEATESSASEAESSSAQESTPASDSSHAESGSAVSESSASESIPSKSGSTSATVWILIGLAVVAAAGAGSMVYLKRRSKSAGVSN